jgi:hypothetical protein
MRVIFGELFFKVDLMQLISVKFISPGSGWLEAHGVNPFHGVFPDGFFMSSQALDAGVRVPATPGKLVNWLLLRGDAGMLDQFPLLHLAMGPSFLGISFYSLIDGFKLKTVV